MKERIIELITKLNKWNNEYYAGVPTVEDFVYDSTLRELKELEQSTGIIFENSPTRNVGTTTQESTFEKVKHITPMLSLDNAFNEEDIQKFINQALKYPKMEEYLVVQPKVDGLSLSLIYDNEGNFVRAVTRGDGIEGEDVTENAKQIKNIPFKLGNVGKAYEIRGEVYISKEDFAKMEGFKNARNAASGSMRLKDVNEVAKRNLSFVAYILLDTETGLPPYEKYGYLGENDIRNVLEFDFGFQALPYITKPVVVEQDGADENEAYLRWQAAVENSTDWTVMEKINAINEMRDELPYEIDGAVVKVEDFETREKLGFTSKFPKWAIAFKYPAEATHTTLRKIFATVGRTGKITYNAELEPVDISGSTVSFASLHNADYIRDLDLREGDIVGVKKAGEIIPKVVCSVSHKEDSVKWEEHTHCPVCNHELVRVGGVDQFCQNNCQVVRQLAHFVSRDAMNIDGVSDKIIESLNKALNLTRPNQFWYITKEMLLTVPGIQEKGANNIVSAIKKASSKVKIYRIINGLGIPLIGKSSAKIIEQHIWNNYATQDFVSIVSKMKEDEFFNSLPDFGDEKVKSITAWMNDDENSRVFLSILNLVDIDRSAGDKPKVELNGIKVVISGVFEDAGRQELKELMMSYGYKLQGAPSGATDYLIHGDNAGPSKLAKVPDEKKVYITTKQGLIDWMESNNGK